MRAGLRITLYSFMAVLTIAVQGYAQPQYTLTDLGPLYPQAIAGPWVVGFEDPSTQQPVRVNIVTGEKTMLQGFGTWGAATSVLPSGEAAGYVAVPDARGQRHQTAAYWNASGHVTLLPGMPPSLAAGLVSGPMLTGVADANRPNEPVFWRAIRWWPDGREEILGTLGGRTSWGNGIDAQGRVWGIASTPGSDTYPITARTHAAVFHLDGRVQDLGTLGGDEYSDIRAVNPEGQAVGNSAGAMLATVDGLIPLPVPPSFHWCTAGGIASGGAAVGTCVEGKGSPQLDIYHATLWPDATMAIDLNTIVNTSGWILEHAKSISADGKIIGLILCNGERRGFLLTPVDTSPSLAIRLNQATFQAGQTLRVTLDLRNPGPILITDVYVGVILPDGQTVLWLTNTAPLEGVVTRLDADPRTFTPMLRNVSWPAGLDATQEDYLTYRFTGGETPGIYHLLVGWTIPGSLDDGRIDEGDVLALAWTPVQFTGQASTLAAKARD
jgi:uncharacterized repeat protein (TIGR01451 family)